MRQPVPYCLQLLLFAGLLGCDQQPTAVVSADVVKLASAAETQGAMLAQIRATTAPYHQVEAALAAGYAKDTPCIYSAPGGRGFIYSRFSAIDGTVDPTQPELMIYEPMKNGSLRLIAVGYLVNAIPWDAANSGPPVLGDQPFVDRRAAPFGGPPFPNYVLLVWLWKHNPDGMYALWNPEVSCEFTDDKIFR